MTKQTNKNLASSVLDPAILVPAIANAFKSSVPGRWRAIR